jgi:hypothetical protein
MCTTWFEFVHTVQHIRDQHEICTSLFARFSAATLRLRCVVFLADGGKLRRRRPERRRRTSLEVTSPVDGDHYYFMTLTTCRGEICKK